MSGYFKYSQKCWRRAEGSGCSTTSQANLEKVIWDQFKADSHTGYRTNKVQRSFFCVLLHACFCIDPRQTFPFCHLEPTLLLRKSSGSTRDQDPTERRVGGGGVRGQPSSLKLRLIVDVLDQTRLTTRTSSFHYPGDHWQ